MKGQIFSTDLFSSLFVFIIIFAALAIMWNNAIERQEKDESLKEIELEAMRVSDLIIRTPGYPANWENIPVDNVRNVGLINSDREIDKDKLNAFLLMNYDESKIKFSIQRFDYSFRLVKANITKGSSGGSNKILIRRPVLFNGTVDTFEFELWK